MSAETLTQTRETIAARKEREYFDYLEYERARETDENFAEIAHGYESEARLDEITDMSERLRMPMESTFYYDRRDDGLYSEFGTDLREVVEGGYQTIVELAKFRPDLAFEVVRRRLDMDELSEVMTLEEGEKLATFLPIPDAVREGRTTIDGYNRERMKMLVRVTARGVGGHSDTISITSFSLDGSHYEAMQAAASAIGRDIPDDEPSEAIVAKRHRFGLDHPDSPEELVSTIRSAYDSKLSELLGGEWYAGRPAISEQNALEFVKSQPDLVDAHMDVIRAIKEKPLSEAQLKKELEKARYNLAAALDDRLNGKEVISLGDAGDGARSEGRNYDGDCATGLTAEEQAMELGYKSESLSCVTCPFCKKVVDAKRTAGNGIQCPECETEVVGGKVIDHKTLRKQKAQQEQAVIKKVAAQKIMAEKAKPSVYFREIPAIGTADLVAYDGDTVIAEGAEAFALRKQIAHEAYELAA